MGLVGNSPGPTTFASLKVSSCQLNLEGCGTAAGSVWKSFSETYVGQPGWKWSQDATQQIGLGLASRLGAGFGHSLPSVLVTGKCGSVSKGLGAVSDPKSKLLRRKVTGRYQGKELESKNFGIGNGLKDHLVEPHFLDESSEVRWVVQCHTVSWFPVYVLFPCSLLLPRYHWQIQNSAFRWVTQRAWNILAASDAPPLARNEKN